MSEHGELTTLQRKAGAGRSPFDAAGMTPAKALKAAFLKAAQAELGLSVRAASLTETRLNHAEATKDIDENLLILTLDGPIGGLGFMLVDSQVLAAIIEIQTLGFVKKSPAVPRKATNTDKAMIKPVINRCLQKFAEFLIGGLAETWATGFSIGERIKNARLLGLRLEDIEFRRLTVSLDLGDGAKQGEIVFVFPAFGNRAVADLPGRDWAQDLVETVQASHGELNAILHRTLQPLNKVRSFKVGDQIGVPISAISEIVMEGVDGQIVGVARLGQQNGFRALRVVVGEIESAAKTATSPAAVQNTQSPEPAMPVLGDLPAMGDVGTVDLAVNTDLPNMDSGSENSTPMDIAIQDTGLPDIGMAPLGDFPDLPDIATDDMAMAPLDAMPIDMAIGID